MFVSRVRTYIKCFISFAKYKYEYYCYYDYCVFGGDGEPSYILQRRRVYYTNGSRGTERDNGRDRVFFFFLRLPVTIYIYYKCLNIYWERERERREKSCKKGCKKKKNYVNRTRGVWQFCGRRRGVPSVLQRSLRPFFFILFFLFFSSHSIIIYIPVPQYVLYLKFVTGPVLYSDSIFFFPPVKVQGRLEGHNPYNRRNPETIEYNYCTDKYISGILRRRARYSSPFRRQIVDFFCNFFEIFLKFFFHRSNIIHSLLN